MEKENDDVFDVTEIIENNKCRGKILIPKYLFGLN